MRAIAWEQGHVRRVVREAIAATAPAPRTYRLREAKSRPVIGPVAPIVDGRLTQDRSAPRKQRHTAKRVYDRLVAEHGFASRAILRPTIPRWAVIIQVQGVATWG